MLVIYLLSTQVVVGHNIDENAKPDTLGVYIKGNIGVFGDDTLGLFGNIYLDNAHQIGEGTIALVDTKPQVLASTNSRVNNLLIKNPTVVTLKGNITVVHTLVVDKGIFDTRRGVLLLSDTDIFVRKNAILLQNDPVTSGNINHKSAFDFQNYFILTQNIFFEDNQSFLDISIFQKAKLYEFDCHTLFCPPPEAIKCLRYKDSTMIYTGLTSVIFRKNHRIINTI